MSAIAVMSCKFLLFFIVCNVHNMISDLIYLLSDSQCHYAHNYSDGHVVTKSLHRLFFYLKKADTLAACLATPSTFRAPRKVQRER